MPLLIKSNKLSGLRPVFTDNLENYKRYIQIRKKFETDWYYRIFAEPKLDNFKQEAEWYTEWEGRLLTFDAFLAANPQISREELESTIRIEVNRLFAECARYKDTDPEYRSLNDTLLKCIEVPGTNDIYVVMLPNGEQKYVLTNWGFITDAFNAQTGLIQKMKVLSSLNLRIRFRYTDGSTAANEKIFAEYNQQRIEMITDQNGDFVINRFPADTSFSIYQVDVNGKKVNAFNFPVIESDLLEVSLKNTHICDHTFIIQDEKGGTIPNLPLVFRVNQIDTTLVSGADGKIAVKDVPDKSAVECYINALDKLNLLHSFQSSLTETEHVIRIPEAFMISPPLPEIPEVLEDITLHFVDKKKVDVVGLPVTLTYPDGSVANMTTANNGCFTIKPLPVGAKVTLAATKDKIRWNGKLKIEKDKNYYLFIFKKKCRWWLWLLLGLLLLLVLLLGTYLFRNCTRQTNPIYDNPINKGTTEVMVVDDADNKAISGASVSLSCGSFNEVNTTGASGKVTFNQVPSPSASQPVVVYVSKAGYGDERQEFTFVQDKIVIRLKKLGDGGLVGKRGQFNVNLQWWTTDDIDLVITDPCGNMIYFKEKKKSCNNASGELDVDANYNEADLTKTPQENIVWAKASAGAYGINVVFYEKREKSTASCKITIFKGSKKEEIYKTINYSGDKTLILVKTVII